jgi:hypothetical protein
VYGWLTPTALSPEIVYAAWIVTLLPSTVPLHDPAAQTCVHLATTESDPIGMDVPFHVPATSVSVIVGAGAGAGAGAIAALAVSAGGVSVFAQATTATTTESNIKTRRITSSRLAAEKGDGWVSLRWGL